MYSALPTSLEKQEKAEERKFFHHVPYEPRARHAFLNHAFSRKNIGFVSDRKINDDENRDKQNKKVATRFLHGIHGWEASWLGWAGAWR